MSEDSFKIEGNNYKAVPQLKFVQEVFEGEDTGRYFMYNIYTLQCPKDLHIGIIDNRYGVPHLDLFDLADGPECFYNYYGIVREIADFMEGLAEE
jgi:hypothetical protein